MVTAALIELPQSVHDDGDDQGIIEGDLAADESVIVDGLGHIIGLPIPQHHGSPSERSRIARREQTNHPTIE
jgi:hypothetical protein